MHEWRTVKTATANIGYDRPQLVDCGRQACAAPFLLQWWHGNGPELFAVLVVAWGQAVCVLARVGDMRVVGCDTRRGTNIPALPFHLFSAQFVPH